MTPRDLLTRLGLEAYLPAFEANHIGEEELAGLTDADLRELGVTSLGHRKKILGGIAASALPAATAAPIAASDLERTVLERFPFPIAFAYQRVLAPDNAATAIKNLIYAYTATLRLPALVLLAEFLQGERQIPQVARALRKLQVPHLNDWFTALNTLAEHLDRPDGFAPALTAAARGFSKLRQDGASVHEAMLRFRNHQDGHSATWSEADSQAQLPGAKVLLDRTLAHFGVLAELSFLRRGPGGGVLRLHGASQIFEEHASDVPALDSALARSGLAVTAPGGRAMPLFPLFLGGEESPPSSLDEPLFTMDGQRKQVAVFMGARTRLEHREALHRYRALLGAKAIDPRFQVADIQPWAVTEWARETSLGAVDLLRGRKYFPAC